MKPECIICDIDGVLSDHRHRIQYAERKEWGAYHVNAHLDHVVPSIRSLIQRLKDVTTIVYSTGRPENMRGETMCWMTNNGVPILNNLLYMRPIGNTLSSAELKWELLQMIVSEYRVWFAIDDQQSVKEMYAREGVMCLQPHEIKFNDSFKKQDDGPDGEDGPWAEGWQERFGITVHEILRSAARTFKEREQVYGSSYKMQGKILSALFPQGLTLKTPEDFTRFATYNMVIGKMNRYAQSWKEGHKDSAHDAGIYSIMLEEIDAIIKAGGKL